VDDLSALAARTDLSLRFSLSHIAPIDQGWAELLAQGMTFDCLGLAPAESAVTPQPGALLGLESYPAGEVLALQPGPHLEGGRGMMPVVRMLAGLGVELAQLQGVAAVCWNPARSWMAPAFFRKVVADWLAGGPFPALGLTTLHRDAEGAMVSIGLGFLVGQDLRFDPGSGLHPAALARIAVRLIHALVENGALETAQEFTGPEGERLLAMPSRGGQQLRISLRR